MNTDPLRSTRLSCDHTTLTFIYDTGTVVLESQDPHGFTEHDVEAAKRLFAYRAKGLPGQHNRAWQHRTRRLALTAHVNTGPPTWKWPHLLIRTPEPHVRTIEVGWLRLLLAFTGERIHNNHRTAGCT